MKPGPTAIILLCLWAAAALAVSAGVVPGPVWSLGGGLVVLLLALDAALAYLQAAPTLSRTVPRVLAQGASTRVILRVANPGRHPLVLEIHDHHPVTFHQQGLPRSCHIPPGQTLNLRYTILPRERGDAVFAPAAAWMASPLRGWHRKIRGAGQQTVRVYPNFQSVSHYNILATGGRLAQLGIHKQPRRGEGLEFLQLREYRRGDPPARIDWRATSRYLKLISREYQDERNQQVVLLLDCGRRMWTRDGDISHLDRSLNGALLLAHIALKQGDSVGLITFGAEENRRLAPRRGVQALDSILNATYDLAPSLYESDVAEALEETAEAVSKRSLIVLLSNLSDHQPENLATVASIIRRRHLLLVASLRERIVDDIVAEPVLDLAGAVLLGATYGYLQERERQLHLLRAEGVFCVDVLPSQLPAALASAYFSLKAQRLI